MDSIVRVSLFPINTRNDIGLQNEQMVQVPPAPGTREMTPAMLLSAIRKQWPSFKLVDDACITVARTTGIAGYAGSTHEQLARDAKLEARLEEQSVQRLGEHADGLAVHAGEADDLAAAEIACHFEKAAGVEDQPDQLTGVEDLPPVARNQ